MRVAKGKQPSAHDRAEIAKFGEYLKRRAQADPNKPGAIDLAYAETYGELVFEDPDDGVRS